MNGQWCHWEVHTAAVFKTWLCSWAAAHCFLHVDLLPLHRTVLSCLWVLSILVCFSSAFIGTNRVWIWIWDKSEIKHTHTHTHTDICQIRWMSEWAMMLGTHVSCPGRRKRTTCRPLQSINELKANPPVPLGPAGGCSGGCTGGPGAPGASGPCGLGSCRAGLLCELTRACHPGGSDPTLTTLPTALNPPAHW